MDSASPSMSGPEVGSRSRSVGWLMASLALAVVVAVAAIIMMTADEESDTPAGPADSVEETLASSVSVGDESTMASTSDTGGSGTTVGSPPSPTATDATTPSTSAEEGESAVGGATTTPATGEGPAPTSDDEDVPDLWTVTSIVVGDTLDVVGPGGSLRVRLLGVLAPSDGQCFADEAVDVLGSLVEGPLVLIEDGPDEDDSGRKLRYVETTDRVDVGAQMILQGAAFADPTSTEIARWQGYAQRQVQAENEGAGMWESGRCDPGEGPG